MAIQKITGYNFAERAAKEGKHFINVPLKNNETANILWNNNSVDCFITENGHLKGARRASGNVEYVGSELIIIFDRLRDLIEPGKKKKKNFIKASFK